MRMGDEMKISKGVAGPQRAAFFTSPLNACPTPGPTKDNTAATIARLRAGLITAFRNVLVSSTFILPGY
jgi:hypothetical protein